MMTLQPQPAPVLEARASSPVSRSATMAKEASERLLEEVWSRLAAFAKEETRAWFEETARHLGRWRGNQADACRRAVREACEASRADASAGPASVSVEARYRAAFELMRSEFCDDKLAGMILFEVRLRASPASDPTPLSPIARAFETTSFLHPRALVSAPRAAPRVPASRPRADPSRVPLFPSPQEHVLPDPSAAPFLFPLEPAGARTDDADAPARDESTDGFPALRDARLAFEDPGDSGVHDWSTSDWMASKVLGPYVAAHPRPRDAARALMAWSALPADAATPWMRRAGLTSFVNLVEGDGGLLGDGGSPSPRTRRPRPRHEHGAGMICSATDSCSSSRRRAARRSARAARASRRRRSAPRIRIRARRRTPPETRKRGFAWARDGCYRCACASAIARRRSDARI